ncbi:hypothetical protein MKX03_009708 [Papaver bracteatum]|nr:hypothetical protein MKX03_009708 [Papaver bracteatum]
MQIFIQLYEKIVTTVEVESLDTVETLKSKIRDREGIPLVDQRLIFGGRQLQDGKTLADYKIENHFTVQLILRLRCCKICPTYTSEKITSSIIQENKTVDSMNWNMMVVIEAKSHIESWEKVGAAMSKKFKLAGDFHLQPVSSTRALFCIENTTEREYLFKQEPWFFEYVEFRFVPWSSGMNLLSTAEIVEISARWVLVRGVPFSLWNSDTFEMIGAQCGGLLEVSNFSKFGLNLSAIKLRVKGPLLSDAFTIQVNH